MTWQRAAIFAALFFWAYPLASLAEDVTLTSRDGAVEITGTLLGFDGEFYRVDTQFGELTVDGSGVLCDGPGCPNLTDFVAEVTFSGSSTMAEKLLPALVEGFALRNGFTTERTQGEVDQFSYVLTSGETGRVVARFIFRISNSDRGFADLLADNADVVMSLREILPDERAMAESLGMGDMTGANRSRVLALDAMVPVVAPENPVRAISLPDLARIFAGDVINWSDMGGADAPISVHFPELGSGMAQAAQERLLRAVGAKLSDGAVLHARSGDLPIAVARDPFAIGIASFAETGAARVLTLSGECGFSLAATRRTIKTEDYPLTAPLFLYLPARRLPKVAREFLRYTASPDAQFVIRRAGFVDQAPEEIAVNRQGDRLSNAIAAAGPETSLEQLQTMLKTLDGMRRLTTSFRFESGSVRLDAQSRSNIQQLARSLEAGVYDARRLLFVGFSDGDGAAASNRNIAMARAKVVYQAVKEAAETADLGRVDTDVAAFGEAMPMACDDSDWGRQVNRRVEVWIR